MKQPGNGLFPAFQPAHPLGTGVLAPEGMAAARRRIPAISAIIKLRMAEPERTTSFAKSVEGLHKEESALDRARSLRDQFVHAQEQNNEKQKPREAEKPKDTEKLGSQMVATDAPVLRPTPNGPMRQMADRQASMAKLSKERTDQARKLQEAQQMRDAFKERQQPSHDHGNDRER